MSYTYEYPRLMLTVDAAVFAKKHGKLSILLIKRGAPPFKDYYALPGGYIDMDETIEQAVARELEEETGISDIELHELKAFSSLNRDPRGRTISIVFYGIIKAPPPLPEAGDDAAEAVWFPVDEIPPLAFDHEEILRFALSEIKELKL